MTTTPTNTDVQLNDVHRRVRNILDAHPAETWTLEESKIVLDAVSEIVRRRTQR
jgi:hypothetical protein